MTARRVRDMKTFQLEKDGTGETTERLLYRNAQGKFRVPVAADGLRAAARFRHVQRYSMNHNRPSCDSSAECTMPAATSISLAGLTTRRMWLG